MAGLGVLLALIVRRDRVKLPPLIVVFVVSLVAMIPLLEEVYGDVESLTTMYATFSANPAGLFMTGPMDAPTFGAFMIIETVLWWGLVVAFINTMLVVRHTRHNEEIGAQELLLSGQVHRATSLAAAMLTAVAVNSMIVFGVGLGVELFDPDWSASQSWLYATGLGVFGLVWAAIAAVVVQLVQSGRSANSMLAALIGIAFVVRGIGDFLGRQGSDGLHEAAWMSSLSPFGWLQMTRSLTAPEWWPLAISLGVAIVAFGLGLVLLARRDVGAGLLPSRRGRARASTLLRSPIGLTLKLQKGIFVGWLAGVLVMVGTIGALVPQMSDIYSSSESMMQMIASIGGVGELIPSFMSAMIAIVSLMVFAYVLQGLMRLRGEEASGHLEHILATRVSRLGWLGLHVVVVGAGGAFMLALVGAMLAGMTNSMSDITVDMWQYTQAGLMYLPVMLAFVGLYVLLFGMMPRAASLVTWLYFGYVAFVSWLGPILQVDERLMNLSVMEHVASAPVEAVQPAPLIIITTVSLLCIIIGMAAWRQRNLVER